MNSLHFSVLLIDDDVKMARMLEEYLTAEHIHLQVAHDGWQAHQLLQDAGHGFDLLILDVTLPGQNGFEILRRLRQQSMLPVIMLTARGSESDRILGLELGADDYLPKPFNPRELTARIRSVLRRRDDGPATAAAPAAAAPDPALCVGSLRYLPRSLEASVGGGMVRLTGTEARILEILMRSEGRMIGREQLTQWALGRKLQADDRSLDTHASNLRRKLGLGPSPDGRPELRSVRGQGYLLTISAGDAA